MTATQPPIATLTPIQKRVVDLESKLKQARALAQKQANQARSKEQAIERQRETRRKVLVGSFMLADGDPLQLINSSGKHLEEWLTRDDDRWLFGLDPIAK